MISNFIKTFLQEKETNCAKELSSGGFRARQIKHLPLTPLFLKCRGVGPLLSWNVN